MARQQGPGLGNGEGPIPAISQLHTHSSTLIEKSLEYTFLAKLTAELLKRGQSFDILRADCDRGGYDLVVEANGTMRHIQLKAMKADGRRRDINVNIDLAAKASGCVIWMIYDPATFDIVTYRWFGSGARAPLPDPGERIAKHSKGNAQGLKAERPQHRIVPLSRFVALESISEVADRLFEASEQKLRDNLLRTEPIEPEPEWANTARHGRFDAIPRDLNWETSLPLAMLIDGYALAGELGLGDPVEFAERQLEAATAEGTWRGDAARLWISLFLEHRRWRFSSPHQPSAAAVHLLDMLVRQLRQALTGENIQ